MREIRRDRKKREKKEREERKERRERKGRRERERRGRKREERERWRVRILEMVWVIAVWGQSFGFGGGMVRGGRGRYWDPMSSQPLILCLPDPVLR